jgi:hypothetical protein
MCRPMRKLSPSTCIATLREREALFKYQRRQALALERMEDVFLELSCGGEGESPPHQDSSTDDDDGFDAIDAAPADSSAPLGRALHVELC